ncbi:hypothetical protein HD806DRAFT_536582 [Xylariaceae sp. AK1471]|nr:hypothetical protein HD806DRAFT_536582 [Xylariaceae sp. AK1471]
MDWSGTDDDSDRASSLNDSDLSQIYQDLLMEDPDMAMNGAQPEVIVLDGDSPVQAQHDEISCKNDVLVVFPNICPDYLAQLALQHNYASGAVISAILDKQEKGEDYPTQAAREPLSRKRKRASGSYEPESDLDHDDDGEGEDGQRDPECARSIRLKIAASEYAAKMASAEYYAMARVLISQDFPRAPQNTIRNYLLANKGSVFETYTAMDEKLRYWDEDNPPWKEKKCSSKIRHEFAPERLPSLDMSAYKAEEQAALAELVAARELRAVKDAKIVAEAEEVNNFLRAQIEGQTTECGICFEECALNRMVQCEGETIHWFCRSCLRSQAESQVGMAKYELTCMSMDGCSAGFSRTQRALFLDKKLTTALDRIEQEAVLRMAGIENLETCPFCPYAAEYPPVEVDKEFRCDNPHCQQVSCRLCRKETHIPKTCAEAATDRGLDARHVLEEAMSEALIRRCNNCQNPFVKQDGCNKIMCTKCRTMQCDVCRKTIKDYSHFNDPKRGGKEGQCPLFDQSEERYEKEVSNAEAETRKKVVEENPEVDKEALRIPISDKVQQDETKRKQLNPAAVRPGQFFLGGHLGDVGRRLRFGAHMPMPPYRGHVRPNDLQMPPHHGVGNMNPIIPAFAMPGVMQPNPAPRPNGRIDDIVKAAEGIVQKARKHMERPAPLRVDGFGSPDAMPLPAPRPRGLENLINKVEDLKKKRNAEARRPDEDAKRPSNMAQANPRPPTPQPRVLRHQNLGLRSQLPQPVAAPNPLMMDFPFHPFPYVARSLNYAVPLAYPGLLDGAHPGLAGFDELLREQDEANYNR